MFESILWGAVLRVCEAFMQAAPTILVGLAVAAMFRRLLGHEGTRRVFGSGTWRELPQSWFIGMLLPICSLGVIPVIREMRRSRVSGGAILAFAMTAPAVQPAVDALRPDSLGAVGHFGVRVLHDARGDGRGGALERALPDRRGRQEPPPPPVSLRRETDDRDRRRGGARGRRPVTGLHRAGPLGVAFLARCCPTAASRRRWSIPTPSLPWR